MVLEGAFRRALEQAGKNPAQLTSGSAVKTLFALGAIGQSDYDFLMTALDARNRVVHGLRSRITKPTVARLISFTRGFVQD